MTVKQQQVHRERVRRWNLAHPKLGNLRKALKKLGLTEAQHQEMYRQQRGCCAICCEPEGKRRMAIDHDHETGQVRGLLCANCNRVLGYAKDSVLRLRAAIGYLQRIT